jgi:hypothetical protein
LTAAAAPRHRPRSSSELNKHPDGLAEDAARPFRVVLDWSEAQFGEMGHREVRRLERWIDSLA